MANELDREYEWDPAKAAANLKKHKVSFIGAATVFGDPYAVLSPDELHSDDKDREIATGNSNRNPVLVVSFVERLLNHIRIISARKATPNERKIYEETN